MWYSLDDQKSPSNRTERNNLFVSACCENARREAKSFGNTAQHSLPGLCSTHAGKAGGTNESGRKAVESGGLKHGQFPVDPFLTLGSPKI